MKRNGKIELMRFFFSLSVLLMHINSDVWGGKKFIGGLTLFHHGNFGVEFFFVTGGLLMAKSIRSQLDREAQEGGTRWDRLGEDTLHFLWRKVKPLLPYHLTFQLIMAVLFVATKPENMPWALIDRLPGLFFLNRTGMLDGTLIGVEWYISSMLLSMAILYPLCKRSYSNFTHLIAPLIALALLGYMYTTRHSLFGASSINGLTYHCNYRAMAETCLGAACYEASQALTRRSYSRMGRFWLTVLEDGCYLCAALFILLPISSIYGFYALLLLCVAVTITFSGQSLSAVNPLYRGRLCAFLGAISLPVYLFQSVPRFAVKHFVSISRPRNQALIELFATLVGAAAFYLMVNTVKTARQKSGLQKEGQK